jgi:phage terminase large subunit
LEDYGSGDRDHEALKEQPVTELNIETARIFERLLKPSRYKGAWGGRGSGKSHFMAGAVLEYCLLHPGARVVCIREVQKTLAQSAKLLIENKIQEFGVGYLFRSINNPYYRRFPDSISTKPLPVI